MSNAMQSTPVYQEYAHIPVVASSHIVVLEHEDDAVLENIHLQLGAERPYQLLIQPHADQHSLDVIQQALGQYLTQAKAGIHTVVVGSERFIWQMQQVLVQHGFMQGEYSLILSGQPQKSLYCVHCSQLLVTTENEYCHCEQCGVFLLIRTHFSQRLGAYMGVCANAHQPMGESA